MEITPAAPALSPLTFGKETIAKLSTAAPATPRAAPDGPTVTVPIISERGCIIDQQG